VTPTLTSAMCPEPAHPHGVVGYTLADPGRTRLRLARWAVLAWPLWAVVALALFSPLEAAAGALPTGVAGRGRAIVGVTDVVEPESPSPSWLLRVARRGVSGGRR
jgi:hypothetical protein